MKRNQRSNPESGSVIYWIFIAVALFAALSFTVSKISRTGNSTGSELSRLRATEITQYAGTIQRAIRIMSVNGVDDSDLCFHAAQWGHNDYLFTPPCTVNDNLVFNPAGGGVSFQEGVENWYGDDITLANGSRTWVFSARFEVVNAGTSSAGPGTAAANADLLIATAPLGDDVCQAVNNLLGFTNPAPPPAPASTYNELAITPFVGVYSALAGRIPDLGRERCVNDGTANMYYKVILAR